MYNQGAGLLDLAWQLVAHKGLRGPSSTDNYGRVFIVPRVSNSDGGQSLSVPDEPKGWLKKICGDISEFSNVKNGIFVGSVVRGSQGFCLGFIYDTSQKDSTTGLPQHSFGLMMWYASNGTPSFYAFGTASYSYYVHRVNTTAV